MGAVRTAAEPRHRSDADSAHLGAPARVGSGPTRLQAVFFDAGNTLLRLDYARLAEALSGLGLSVSPEEAARAEWRIRPALDRHLRAGHSTEEPETVLRYRRLILRELDPEGRVEEPAYFEALAGQERVRHPYGEADPEAREAITMLKARGFRVGVISNADGSLARLLAETGLAALVDAALDSHVVGFEKPDPEIFRLACREIGVAPCEAAHIGDLPWIDTEGARAAGLDGWLLDPGDVFADRADLPRAAGLLDFARRVG